MNSPKPQVLGDSQKLPSRKPVILWISDSPTCPTGYGRVTCEILSGLQSRGYTVFCLGVGYDGWPYDTRRLGFPIFPSPNGVPSLDVVERAVSFSKPDCIIALGDLWMMPWVENFKRKESPPVVGYIPIDGGPLPRSWKLPYKSFDKLVTTSHFAAKQLETLLPELKVDVIYHGINSEKFRPLHKARKEFKARLGLQDKFVIGCVAKNQTRKYFPSLIEAFGKFHAIHPESALYLHTSREPSGWVLEDFVSQYGVSSHVFFPPEYGSGRHPELSDESLNELYNTFDVMALPTTGEGFGLPILEAMAAGIPVIATNNSACTELLRGRGLLIDVKCNIYLGGQIVQNSIPDVTDFAAKLCELYSNDKLRRRLGSQGISFGRRLSWSVIIDQWEIALTGIIQSGRKEDKPNNDAQPTTTSASS